MSAVDELRRRKMQDNKYKNVNLGNDVLTDEKREDQMSAEDFLKLEALENENGEDKRSGMAIREEQKYDGALNKEDLNTFSKDITGDKDPVTPTEEEIKALNDKAAKVKEEMLAEEKKKYELKAYENMQKVQDMKLERRGWMRVLVHHQNKELDLWGHGEAGNGEVRITVIYGYDPFFGIGSHAFPMMLCKITFFTADTFKEITGGFEKAIEDRKNGIKPEETTEMIALKLNNELDKVTKERDLLRNQYGEAKHHPFRNIIKQLLNKIMR